MNDFLFDLKMNVLLLFIEQQQKFIGTKRNYSFIHQNQENGITTIGLGI